MHNVEFDIGLIKKYDKSGPRYTSYPTAVQFHEEFGLPQYLELCDKSNLNASSLSLYFHLPFCDTLCFYCACNKVVTKNRKHAEPYLDHLLKEISLQGKLFDQQRRVSQLHWGGGTPTFFNPEQMQKLMDHTRENFSLCEDDSGEYSIEIDPREVTASTVALLRQLGFNRISMGVQDFDERVQKAVNRIQPLEITLAAVDAARNNDFKSISLDLIYGLPFQNMQTFNKTLDTVIDISPDRLSVFNYAHLPEMFKPQRRINQEDLPSAEEKLNILQNTIDRLADAGYVYIGMDHFAKPNDELAIAQQQGSLYRNFQGYSTHAECDLVAMGITSIGKVANSYSQNVKDIESYIENISRDHIPVYRGVMLDEDDVLRRQVITELMCHFRINFKKINDEFSIDFAEYFQAEINRLQEMQNDGLLKVTSEEIVVLPVGRLLIRNVAMIFDKYLMHNKSSFSKVI